MRHAPASTTTSPSDAQLLRQYVRQRDDAAFGRLVGRHIRAVRHVAYRYTHHRQAAEDVAQAAFLVMAQRPRQAMRSAKWKRSALPWLAKVARYAAANWRRAEERRHRHETRAAPLETAHYDPTAGVELAEAVRSALACLPRRDRRIVEWRHLSQMPWDEVARHAGTTPEAARKAGTRALSQLRVVLEKRGITAGSAAVLAGLRAMTLPAQSSAATLTAALSPAQIAHGVLTMLKAQTAAVTISALLTTAGLVTTASALMQDEPPQTTRAAQPGAKALVGQLSDGTTVTLLAVGDQRGVWWTPHGKPTIPGQRVAEWTFNASQQRQLVFSLEISNGNLGLEDVRFDSSGVIGTVMRTSEPGAERLQVLAGLWIPRAGAENLALSVALPVGKPQNLGTWKADERGGALMEDGGTVDITMVGEYLQPGGARATFVMVSAEPSDTPHHFTVTIATSDGHEITGLPDTTGGAQDAPLIYRFSGVPLDRVRDVSIAAREVETVRFTDVASQVFETTEPDVELVETDSGPAEPSGE